MKTQIKTLVLTIAALICFTAQSDAQTVSAAVIDQHYAAQASFYKTMMLALAAVAALYIVIYTRHKRQVNRYMGRI